MRVDTKALLKVFGMRFAVAVVVIGVASAAIVGGLTEETTVKLIFGCLVVYMVVVIGISIWKLYPARLLPQPRKDKPTEPLAAPDDGEE